MSTPRDSDPIEHRVCDACGRWVDEAELLYIMRVELYAEPTRRLADTSVDSDDEEWEKLLHQLEHMSDDDVREANDQVYESMRLLLCSACRERVHANLRTRRDLFRTDNPSTTGKDDTTP